MITKPEVFGIEFEGETNFTPSRAPFQVRLANINAAVDGVGRRRPDGSQVRSMKAISDRQYFRIRREPVFGGYVYLLELWDAGILFDSITLITTVDKFSPLAVVKSVEESLFGGGAQRAKGQ